MRGANSDIDSLASYYCYVAIVEGDLCSSFNYHPVFGALSVFLVTQPFARQHFNSLDFETVRFIEHSEGPPRPAIKPRRVIRIW
jgi:hypothetical protein